MATKNQPKKTKQTKKQPKIFKITKNKPEKTLKAHKITPYNPKQDIQKTKSWVGKNIGIILAVILALASILFLITMGMLYLEQQSTERLYKDLASENKLAQQEIDEKRELIGTKKQLESEIISFQSAPSSLQQYALRDYAVFKSKCIVNGRFIGPTTYEIASVVYDQYAKIITNCQGKDSKILTYIGGSWTIVHKGNSAPKCSDVNSLDIPQGVASTCTDGKILYPNPNP